MDRRSFLKRTTLAGAAIAAAPTLALAEKQAKAAQAFSVKTKGGFTMWQLPSQVNTIGNSYVFITDKGRVIVMDGGVAEEELYLRGFLGALGNEVEAWFISHPHPDHMGALNAILKDPKKLKINAVYHSRFSEGLIGAEPPCVDVCHEFYGQLDRAKFKVVDVRQPGLELQYDGLNLKVLSVVNEELRMNPYNNSSMIMRVWDKKKSVVFLGDAGIECGDKVFKSEYRPLLDCDYMQMAHHGQNGCTEEFYKAVKFRACLWPTPTWVWNNDAGQGINTGPLKTFDTRRWMDEKGITEHHVSTVEGLYCLS